MVVEKRKSQNNAGGVASPKRGNFGSPFQKSPGGQHQKGKFGGGGGGGGGGGQNVKPGDWKCPKAACGVNNFASRNECFKCKVKRPGDGAGNPKKEVPPPPAQGAKKLNVQVVPPQKAVVKPMVNTSPEKSNQKSVKKEGKNVLNKVSDASKGIKKPKKKQSRAKKIQYKLDLKPRPIEACEKALKTEKELGHTGRVYSVKVADPPLNQAVVKGWSSGVETAVFSKPVEARQFLVVFKHNANVKKELEALRKVTFAGGKLQVEEKSDADVALNAHPEAIDPFSLYVTNLNEEVTKENLKELFPKASNITNAKKHSPKFGTPTKFAFITFENTEDALSSFKENYSAVLNGNSIVMRFRRVSPGELAKANAAAKVAASPVAAKKPEAKAKQPPTPKAGTPAKPAIKKEPIKAEPESEDDDEDDDEDDEDEEAEGVGMAVDEDDDDDEEDDEGEGIGEEDEDDDDDDDDDDDEEDDDDDDDDDDDE